LAGKKKNNPQITQINANKEEIINKKLIEEKQK